MTNLERLIKTAVESATVTISRSTEQIAEEMAREILRDDAFRARVRALIERHFTGTLDTLASNGKGRRRRARKTVR